MALCLTRLGAIVRHPVFAATFDLPVPDDGRARHVIGLGLVDALSHVVPELPAERYQAMVERYCFAICHATTN